MPYENLRDFAYKDKTLKCVDCPDEFVFTAGEQEFFSKQSFIAPKRCKPCRLTHKANKKPVPGSFAAGSERPKWDRNSRGQGPSFNQDDHDFNK